MDKKKDEEIRGIQKISTFLTADALLAAVLIVWAQIWIQPSVQLWTGWYGKKQPEEVSNILHAFDFNVGLGLLWTYSAVFFALLALAWASWRTLKNPSDRVPTPAVALFMTSVTMAIVNVLGSIYSISNKLFSGIWVPLSLPWWWLYLEIAAVLGIVGLSMWFAHRMRKTRD